MINRCIEDVRAVQSFAGDSLVQIVQLGVLSVGVVTVLIVRNPSLAIIALLPLVPMVMMTTDFGQRITRLFYDVDNTLGDLSAQLQENVSGVQVVRAFAREPHEIERFDQINRTYFKARVKVLSEWSKVMPTTNLLITMSTILILMVSGPLVLQGKMTVGELVAFNAYLLMLSGPVQQLAWLVNAIGESEVGAQRVLEILDHEPEIQSPAEATELGTLSGRVEFRGVSLRYKDEKIDALFSIDLSVEPNQVIALIGQTGSGKTSLVNLIPRFYDVGEAPFWWMALMCAWRNLCPCDDRSGLCSRLRCFFPTISARTSAMDVPRSLMRRYLQQRKQPKHTISLSSLPKVTRHWSASAA